MSKSSNPFVIVNTRPVGQGEELSFRLRELGFVVHDVPALEIEHLRFDVSEVIGLKADDWVVFTSVNAVNSVHRALQQAGHEEGMPLLPAKVAVVGAATQCAVEKIGLPVRVSAEGLGGEVLTEKIIAELKELWGGALESQPRVVFFRAETVAFDISGALALAGIQVQEVIAYRTREHLLSNDETLLLKTLSQDKEYRVLFILTSSRGARAVATWIDELSICLKDSAAIAIGPKTFESAKAFGFNVKTVSASADTEGIVKALLS